MEDKIKNLYEEINFLGFHATYHRDHNYVEKTRCLMKDIQEFVQWFIDENDFGLEKEIYENLADILKDCETALKEHDHVLMLDALEQGISGYLEMFLNIQEA